MDTLAFAGILAAILGFAAHRASICTVRAVVELLTSRQGCMLASIGKSVLWASAVTIPFFLLAPTTNAQAGGWQLSGIVVLGGFVFGIGAAVNGSCAFSTMGRLADGDLGMVVTIVGFLLGTFGFIILLDWQWLARPVAGSAMTPLLVGWVSTAALLGWVTYETVRLWRTRPPGVGFQKLVLAGQYRLSTAAMLMGLAGGAIFLIYGPWGYTSTLQQGLEGLLGRRPGPGAERWMLLSAVLIGMVLSTLQRGSFRLDWRPRFGWLKNLCGGTLMGLGVAMVPGGNDALVLYGIPSLSPHALPAFLALAAGVAAGLMMMRRLLGIEMRAECRNDLCILIRPAEPKPLPPTPA